MLVDNVIFWQSLVFLAFGFLTSAMVNAMVGVPRRLIEAQ